MSHLLNNFKGDGLKAQLLRGAGGTGILKVINVFLTLVVGVLLARALGAESYGVYSFVLSLIALLGLPTKAGLPALIVRETAKYRLNAQWGPLRGLLTLANGFVLSFSVLIAIVSSLLALWLWDGTESAKSQTFIWSLWLLPLIAFGNIRSATLKGLKRVVVGQLPEGVVQPVVMVGLLGGALLLGVAITPVSAVQYTIVAALVSFLVGAALLVRAFPDEFKRERSNYDTRAWTASLIPLSMISGMQIINTQVGIIWLGSLGLNEEIGFLKISTSAAGLVSTVLMMLNSVLAPHIVTLWHQSDLRKLSSILTITARLSFLSSIFISIIFFAWGREIISLIFGGEYTPAYAALVALLVGQIISAAAGSVGLLLKQVGLEKKVLVSSVSAFILNCTLCSLLVPTLGLIGVAVSSSISIIVWNAMNWYFALRYAGLDCSVFAFNRIRVLGL